MRTMMLAVAVLVGAVPALAQDKKDTDIVAKKEIESKMRNLRITLDFKSTKLTDIADYIREISGLNIFVSNKTEGKAEDITIKVQDLTLKSCLSLILRPRGLTYVIKDGVVMLTTQDEANQDVIMEIYDLRDLLYVVPDFPGVDISLAESSLGTTVIDNSPPSSGGELPIEELVKAHTGGKTWEENTKASISLQNGLLVVKQTREVHAQIQHLIGQLRNFK